MEDKLKLDKHAMKDSATAHLRIYVGGLKDEVTVEDLYNHFIQYGEIDGIILNRVFGFVQFSTEESAQNALSNAAGSMILGKKINVRPAQKNLTRKEEHQPIQQEVSVDNAGHDDSTNDQYDIHGNFIGDQYPREEEYEETGYKENWYEPVRGGPRGRGMRGRGRGRGGPPPFRGGSPKRGPAEWPERYDRFKPEYPRALPVPERNDCEIIVVSKALTEYAEYIESRLKRLGIVVDLLFPMEDVPIGKVLGNIASRGCLYAILVTAPNQEHRSLTLTILHGLPQEHRNMPLEDALSLLSRNFAEVQRGGSGGREAVYALLGQLADGGALTVLQYEKVIEFLQEKKEQQKKLELGEEPPSKTETELQQRILSILNDKKPALKNDPPPVAAPAPKPDKTQLLNDPSVKKALDSILQRFV
ncbi:nuclear receptor coactivator 5 [Aricia agestis]|uniref:nuclear receptor coactivator 5 n=1 Tax=Aricia agestis TaxID=91739 RepID=UPI001C2020A4|nr:nuclear receptor coactivator 5 [Aricia agestis]